MALKGTLLKTTLMGLRVLEFLIAGLILGIYSYFLSVLADRNLPIRNVEKAVEGISGAACLYTVCGFLFTCCCGGAAMAAGVAIFLDIAFVIGFVAIAIMAKGGATNNCSDGSFISTPVGDGIVGQSSQVQGFGSSGFGQNSQGTANVVAGPTFRYACNLEKAAFAVAIIGIFLFLVTAALTFLLAKNHRTEKRYGPSPSNNYTAGSGKRSLGSRFGFRRNKGPKTSHAAHDAEVGTGVGLTGTALQEKHHHNDGMVSGTTTTNGVTGMDSKYDHTATNGKYDNTDVNGNYGNTGFDRTPATHYRNV